MSYPVGPVAAPDQYQPQTTIETQECARLDLFVSNAPIYYQLQLDGNWLPEHYIPSASGQTYFISFDRRFTGIRFRNAIAGTPATVAGQLIPQSELPDNA